jgi:DNA-binding HxlR family transcriptional regulator
VRQVFAVVPPRVEYTLTPLGESLLDIVRALAEWSAGHTSDIAEARRHYDRVNANEG